MLSFTQFITEEKNLHLVHAEDAVIDGGVNGTRQVINYIRAIRDMFAGNTTRKISMNTKFDGAPAVFAGYDPADGKFFVAKKGIFNKNPKIYKTPADVDADTSGDLNVKLKLALAEFPKLGMSKNVVLQGDFLYSAEDIKTIDVDGQSYVTFHPNTIVYSIPAESDLAKTIQRSKIGVVWHTVYRGDDIETMSASFGEKIAGNLKTVNSVWSVDAYFDDVSGKATFTKDETDTITKMLSDAGKIFQKLRFGIKKVKAYFGAEKDYGCIETDSGLDIDALRIVANGVNKLKNENNAVLVITHYQRLLDYIVPDFVHVLMDGKIVKSGTAALALELEEKGYDWIKEELV